MAPRARRTRRRRWQDERNMAALIEHLDLSEFDYESAVVFANHYLNDPDIKGYRALLCSALSRVR